VLQYHVDALVLASTTLSSRLAADCNSVGIPVVLLNRTSKASGVSSVTGDNAVGGSTLAAFLAAAGHRRFAYMAGLDNASTGRERERGYNGWLATHGFGMPLRAVGNYDFATTMQAAGPVRTRQAAAGRDILRQRPHRRRRARRGAQRTRTEGAA
jgi:DNA-binding LacI/PurR family transcriptional regulator